MMQWIKYPSISLLTAMLAIGCATRPEPVIRTVEVLVPVPVSCVPEDFPPAPDYPDMEADISAASDRAEGLALIGAGRALRIARLADMEAVVDGCR
jgi:hypothetical protein